MVLGLECQGRNPPGNGQCFRRTLAHNVSLAWVGREAPGIQRSYGFQAHHVLLVARDTLHHGSLTFSGVHSVFTCGDIDTCSQALWIQLPGADYRLIEVIQIKPNSRWAVGQSC